MHKIQKEDIDTILERLKEPAEVFQGKTILITGAYGFLGSVFRTIFNEMNKHQFDVPCKIIAIDNLITNSIKLEDTVTDNQVFINHDMRNQLSLDCDLDFVIHCAGIASPFYYKKFPLETIEVATLGTKNVLEICRSHNAKALYFSSSEIYGDPDPNNIPTKESYKGNVACLGPRACYDESKRMGETLCHIYYQIYNTAVSIVRPFNVYGPGMRENDYRVLPSFASSIKAGLPVQVYSNGKQTRTYCYTTDALVGFLLTLIKGHSGEAYNIGNTGPELSVLDLVEKMEGILGKEINKNLIDYPDSYPGDEPNRRCPDLTKSKEHLNYSPQIDIDEGLKRYLDWSQEVYTGKR